MSDHKTVNIHLGSEIKKQSDLFKTGIKYYKKWENLNQNDKNSIWLFLLLNELQTNWNSFEYLEVSQVF